MKSNTLNQLRKPFTQTAETEYVLNALTVDGEYAKNIPVLMDAFNYNFFYGFRYKNTTMTPFKGLEALRRCQGDYRMRIIRCPGEGYATVAAYDTIEWRTAVRPGSYIWGIQSLKPSGLFELRIQIKLGASQYPVFNTQPKFSTDFGNRSPSFIPLINPPLIVPSDGSILVSISSGEYNFDLAVFLYVAEPKEAI